MESDRLESSIDFNKKANEIINKFVEEGISFGEIEKILNFAEHNMRLLIPSKSNNPLTLS